jgi:hypothetical protein
MTRKIWFAAQTSLRIEEGGGTGSGGSVKSSCNGNNGKSNTARGVFEWVAVGTIRRVRQKKEVGFEWGGRVR